MFRFLENLVDPYQPYVEQDAPPTRLWPFLKDYIRPFKAIFAVTALFSVGNAVLDVGMIWYLSRLVDLMTGQTPQSPAQSATAPTARSCCRSSCRCGVWSAAMCRYCER